METRWSRNARYLVLLFVIILLVWFLYLAHELIGPLLIAALLAYVLNPLVTTVNMRSKLPRNVVVALLYLISLGVVVLLVVLFTPLLARQAQLLSQELQDVGSALQESLAQEVVVLGVQIAPYDILDLDAFSAQFIRSDRLLMVLEAATTNLVWILVILVTTYYLLQDWERLREWLFGLAPAAAEDDLRRLYADVKEIWQSYLRGQLVLMLIMGFLTGITLAAVGTPGAAVIGLITGLLDVIPTLGPTIAMLIAVVIAWLGGSTYLPLSGAWFALLVAGLHGLVQGVENAWLRPRIMSSRLQMHPAVVFLGIVGTLSLVGVLGALVVVPVLGTAGVVGSYLRRRILGVEPWPAVSRSQE